MNLRIYSGTCVTMATQLEAELELIDGAKVERIDDQPEPDGRGMRPIVSVRLEVDGNSVYEGYDAIRAWIERHHHLRVARRHTRLLQSSRATARIPAYV